LFNRKITPKLNRNLNKDMSVTAPQGSIGHLSKSTTPAPLFSDEKSPLFFDSRRVS